jgi:hypothetical protein
MNGSVGNNSKFVMADLTSAGNRPLADFHHNNSSTNELSDQTANDWTVHEAGPFIDGKFALVGS